MRYCWNHDEPFVVGKHTAAICAEIDQAIANYRAGKSTFLIVSVPFRHGKSEILSRFLPPRWLGEFPDKDVMLATYGQHLADSMAHDARRIIESDSYQRCYPGVFTAYDTKAGGHWKTTGGGSFSAVGLGGPMTGKGYSLGLVDDYLKGRAEAESVVIRDKLWDSFTNDFLTRQAAISVTIILATRWHMDDIIGRIIARMATDPTFPTWKVIVFPAWTDNPEGRQYLFPERFSPEYYQARESELGVYGTQSLLLCDPRPRSGLMLKTDKVQIVTLDKVPGGLRWVRAWDLASTKKELVKQDPDWTVGFLMAVERLTGYGGMAVRRLWVKDMIRGRWDAPTRDRMIRQAAEIDGPSVVVATESVAGYKDTYQRLAEVMRGIRIVQPVVPPGDLVQRAGAIAPLFDDGRVFFVHGDWNQRALAGLGDFPSGAHDDEVAALSTGFEWCERNWPIMGVSEYLRKTNQLAPGMRGRPPDDRWQIRLPTRRA
jgi:predicted phage terminase large subunit-like protein